MKTYYIIYYIIEFKKNPVSGVVGLKIKKTAARLLGRSMIFGVLLLMQILFLIAAVISIGKNIFTVYTFIAAADICFSLIIINSSEPSAYKLTWLFAVNIFPFVGGIGYIFMRISRRIPRTAERNYRRNSVEPLLQDNTVAAEFLEEYPQYFGLAKYVAEYGGYPVCRCENTEYFPIGEQWFDSVIKELENAEKFIFMEFFIIREGYVLAKISEILLRKAAEGIDVRLLYDGIGTGINDCMEVIGKLERGGVKCREFNPFRPFLSSVQNNRDHRKIIVIDGKKAFSGGTNLADEYINRRERFGHWKDTAVMLEGSAVWNYTVMFLQLWDSFADGRCCTEYRPLIPARYKRKGFIQPFSDSPFDNETVGKRVYLELINTARDYVLITTPYFIPDEELLNALIFAARKGVEIKLIIPHIPDKKYVHIITRSFFPELVEAGIKVYEYLPGFIHGKCCVSDGKAAVIGSINFDYRSFYMHFETAAIFYGAEVISEIQHDFDKTAELSHLVTYEECRKRSIFERLAAWILVIFSPVF